jgi:predicted nucleic acid-binding protein
MSAVAGKMTTGKMAIGKVFIDSNIILYAWNDPHGSKGAIAQKIIADGFALRNAVISLQVLQEFYSVSTTKMGGDKLAMKDIVQRLTSLEVVEPDVALLQEAIEISILAQLSFWDAMIVAAAVRANCSTLYSEDLNSGQSVRGVKIVNPFA